MLSFVSVLGQPGEGRQTQLGKGQGFSVQGVRGSPPSCHTWPGGGPVKNAQRDGPSSLQHFGYIMGQPSSLLFQPVFLPFCLSIPPSPWLISPWIPPISLMAYINYQTRCFKLSLTRFKLCFIFKLQTKHSIEMSTKIKLNALPLFFKINGV